MEPKVVLPSQQKRCFALIECNNFYASCEKLFRPDLKDNPVIVASTNDGCAVARSMEAKALGIKVGTPLFQMKDLIRNHQIQVFSSNYALYADDHHGIFVPTARDLLN